MVYVGGDRGIWFFPLEKEKQDEKSQFGSVQLLRRGLRDKIKDGLFVTENMAGGLIDRSMAAVAAAMRKEEKKRKKYHGRTMKMERLSMGENGWLVGWLAGFDCLFVGRCSRKDERRLGRKPKKNKKNKSQSRRETRLSAAQSLSRIHLISSHSNWLAVVAVWLRACSISAAQGSCVAASWMAGWWRQHPRADRQNASTLVSHGRICFFFFLA